MSLQRSTPDTPAWHWEIFGKEFAKQNQEKWKHVNWGLESQRYGLHILDQFSTIELDQEMDPVLLETIAVDTKLLKRPTRRLHYKIENLQQKVKRAPETFQKLRRQKIQKTKIINGLALVKKSRNGRLFILGKSGVGKTFFLKHLALKTILGDLDRIPIFVDLSQWQTGDEISELIARPFRVCNLPDTKAFLKHLLSETKHALILLDGLDAIPPEQRGRVKKAINQFSLYHPLAEIVLTCRTGTINHTSWMYNAYEILDFDEGQMFRFVRRWFHQRGEPDLIDHFWGDLSKSMNRPLHDLGNHPRFLLKLCHMYKKPDDFSLKRRIEFYENTLNELPLTSKDTHQIAYDTVYHNISRARKQRLIAYLAFKTFCCHRYFLEESDLASILERCLEKFPVSGEDHINKEGKNKHNGEIILQAIESENGVMVKYERHMYTFAYLPYQEYFAACDIIDRIAADKGETIQDLLDHVGEERWREVILIIASRLKQADVFFQAFLKTLSDTAIQNEKIVDFLGWLQQKAQKTESSCKPITLRAFYADLALDLGPDLDLAHSYAHTLIRAFDQKIETKLKSNPELALDYMLHLALTQVDALYHQKAYTLFHSRSLYRAQTPNYIEAIDCIQVPNTSPASNLKEPIDESIQHIRTYVNNLDDISLEKAISSLKVPAELAKPEKWKRFREELRKIMTKYRYIGWDWRFTEEQADILACYFTGANLLVKCLEVASIDNRQKIDEEIENSLLLPPKKDEKKTTQSAANGTKILGKPDENIEP